MDSPKNIILPTMICLTLVFIIYYRYYSKKAKKTLTETQPEEEKNEKNINIEMQIIPEKKEEIGKKEEEWKITFNMLFDKFCEYIQKNKLVSVEAIAEKLHKSKEETIKFLRELEMEGKTQGFLGDDGEYFFLTMKELELLNNLLKSSKNKKMNEEELQKQFDEIMKEREDSLF